MMLLKHADDRSVEIATLRRLLERSELSSRQHSDIHKEIDNIVTGYRGERDAAYFLNDAFAGAENTALIHDLRIEHKGRTAQIDHLLLTRFRWAYVLETKNLNANLSCNAAGEWTAWYGKRPVPIASPIEQARRHVEVPNSWLDARAAGMRRIEVVIIVSPTSYVGGERTHGDETVPIIRADLFKRWWQNERVTIPTVGILWAAATAWSTSDFEALANSVVAAHCPKSWDWAAKFGLPATAASISSRPRAPLPVDRPPAAGSSKAARDDSIALVARTSLGPVTIRIVGDGRFALRHAANPHLASEIAALVSEFANWQPRFKNWLIDSGDVERVLLQLKSL